MVGECGPPGGGVADAESCVAVEVGAEPVGEVGRCPGVAVVVGEEVLGDVVEFDEAVAGNGPAILEEATAAGAITGIEATG